MSESLTFTVGYYGGPYVQVASFTAAQLESSATRQTFSLLGTGKVMYACIEGVTLTSLLNAAKLNNASTVEQFQFLTADRDTVSGFRTFSRQFLLGTDRYYYPNLADNFDFNRSPARPVLPAAAANPSPVEAMLALREARTTFTANPEEKGPFAPDYTNLTADSRFRLYFGMDAKEFAANTNDASAKWVYEIRAQLAGAPTLSSGGSYELELNKTAQLQVDVSTHNYGDLQQQVKAKLKWTSAAPAVARVDSDGKVTMLKEGKATITVEFGTKGTQSYASATYYLQTPTASSSSIPQSENTSSGPESEVETPSSASNQEPENPAPPESQNENSDPSSSSRRPSPSRSQTSSSSSSSPSSSNGSGSGGTGKGDAGEGDGGNATGNDPAPALPQAAQVYALPGEAQPAEPADAPPTEQAAEAAAAPVYSTWKVYEVPGEGGAEDLAKPSQTPYIGLAVASVFLLGAVMEILLHILRR